MELHTLKEKDMKLLSRKRVSLEMNNEGSTPSRIDLVKAIAKKFNVTEELIVIKHIYSQFGKNKTRIIAHIYQDKDKVKMFELQGLISKHKPKEAAKPAE